MGEVQGKKVFCVRDGDITDTGNKSGAGSEGEENEFSFGYVVLELLERCLAGCVRQQPGNKSLGSEKMSEFRWTWQLLV